MLLLLQELECIGKNSANGTSSHLQPYVFTVLLVSYEAIRKHQRLLTHKLHDHQRESDSMLVMTRKSARNISYLCVMNSDAADETEWSQNVKCRSKRGAQTNHLDDYICSSAICDFSDPG